MDHRVRSESINRLIAEIDDEVSTSLLAWVLPIAGSRAINADVVGDSGGDGDGSASHLMMRHKLPLQKSRQR